MIERYLPVVYKKIKPNWPFGFSHLNKSVFYYLLRDSNYNNSIINVNLPASLLPPWHKIEPFVSGFTTATYLVIYAQLFHIIVSFKSARYTHHPDLNTEATWNDAVETFWLPTRMPTAVQACNRSWAFPFRKAWNSVIHNRDRGDHFKVVENLAKTLKYLGSLFYNIVLRTYLQHSRRYLLWTFKCSKYVK